MSLMGTDGYVAEHNDGILHIEGYWERLSLLMCPWQLDLVIWSVSVGCGPAQLLFVCHC